MSDAIQEDVSEEVEPNPRNDALAEIAERHREQREEELKAEEEEQEEEIQEEPEPEPKKRKLKVDGQEMEVEEDKILEAGIRALQKESTADQRLAEATRLLNEAKEFKPPSQDADKEDAEKPSINMKEVVDLIRYGEESEAAEALDKLLNQGRDKATPEVDPNQITEIVNSQIEFNNAVSMLNLPPDQGGFSDLWTDPNYQALMIQKEKDYRSQGDTRSHRELYSAIGTEVREWRDGLIKSADPLTERERKKDQLSDSIETKGGKPPPPEKPKSQEEKRKEALEKMAQSRGGQL